MSAAAKRTLLLAASLLALVAVSVVGAAGGAPPEKDREAPSAPQNLRVSEVTQTLVRLAWDASSDNVAVAGYYVFGDRGKATLETAGQARVHAGRPFLRPEQRPDVVAFETLKTARRRRR